jgi:RNA polymerase sigma factor (sigma-70 family)
VTGAADETPDEQSTNPTANPSVTTPLSALLHHLRRTLGAQRVTPRGDAELLGRWLEQRDEAAFELLLLRHGPLVLGACRRLLWRACDVEDAFQATFLVLLRRAGSVRRRTSLAGWLHTVAYRVACRLRATALRRREDVLVGEVPAKSAHEAVVHETRDLLDAEISRLPDRYRSAFVLCHVQGKTNVEAAAELGCPVGTIQSRLAWARERLRKRLSRRGIFGAGAGAALLAASSAEAAVSPQLVESTLGLAASWAAGKSTTAATGAASLAMGALKAMSTFRLKITGLGLLAVGVLGTATAVAYRGGAPTGAFDEAAPVPTQTPRYDKPLPGKAAQPDALPAHKSNLADVPALYDGPLTVIGTEALPGEKVPERRRVTAKVGFLVVAIQPGEKLPADQQIAFPNVKQRYRRWQEGDPLKEPGQPTVRKHGEEQKPPYMIVAEERRTFSRLEVGDPVKADQMVALVDPTIAIKDLSSKNAQMNAAEAEVLSSMRTKEEALRRYLAMQDANRKVPNSVSKDDLEGGRLTWERYAQEQVSKEAALVKAQQELLLAVAVLEQHTVRTLNAGVVKKIYKNRGEAVRKFDPVIQVEISEPVDK